MTECNRKNRLLGKSIRKIRMRRNMTQRELANAIQMMGTRGGGTSGSWFPGKPETPQKRHGKGCGGTPFSMSFLLSH